MKEMARLHPDGDVIFHQDSAPSHVARTTLKFMDEANINYIKPSEWLANSPDAAPCDYFLWDYLRKKLQSRKASTIASLKTVIRDELKKIPLEFIINALKAWPRRVLEIYKAHGGQVERY